MKNVFILFAVLGLLFASNAMAANQGPFVVTVTLEALDVTFAGSITNAAAVAGVPVASDLTVTNLTTGTSVNLFAWSSDVCAGGAWTEANTAITVPDKYYLTIGGTEIAGTAYASKTPFGTPVPETTPLITPVSFQPPLTYTSNGPHVTTISLLATLAP